MQGCSNCGEPASTEVVFGNSGISRITLHVCGEKCKKEKVAKLRVQGWIEAADLQPKKGWLGRFKTLFQ